MRQLTQKLKNGVLQVIDAPLPQVGPGFILVKNHYSLVSAGTEGGTVRTARKSLLGKAKERPQQVKQVIDTLKQQGVTQTFRAVSKKLDSLSPLGYSCAGQVIDVGAGVSGFEVGEFVACGGNTANHAEVVSVPRNLCVKLDLDLGRKIESQLKAASFNTLGAIAMQGVRQADLRLGETCAVIGLGLLGQLTGQLLKASGVRVVGTDIDAVAVSLAAEHSVDLALMQTDSSAAEQISRFSDGLGVDAVIITAASQETGPINFAGEIVRKKGKVVIVGDVATGFDRNPHYYRKELEVRMSCSYGPGRYDPNYEEHGIDYPPAYVRWSENRNMEAFQSLVSRGSVNVEVLTTHCFSLDEAPAAYDMILNRTEPFLGVLIEYDVEKPLEIGPVELRPVAVAGQVNLAFIGAGSYAQGSLLPNLPKDDSGVSRVSVMTQSGTSSRSVAHRFGFSNCVSDADDILENNNVNTVFISTRHDSHAEYVLAAMQAGKHVFVEKPLCIHSDELESIEQHFFRGESPKHLMVGYNRRFAPLALSLKARLGSGPAAMNYRINAGSIPADHWAQDPEIGGGRIIGELCHFLDFMVFVSGSLPKTISAVSLPDPQGLNDTVTVNAGFENGSVGSIVYVANGSKAMPKERFEVFKDGQSAVLDDFKTLEIYGKGRPTKKRLASQDKGQAEMIRLFLDAVKSGKETPIPAIELFAVSRATFAVLESIRSSSVISV